MSARRGVRGNPEELALKALDPYRREAMSLLNDAMRAAEKLVEEAASNATKEAQSKIKSRAESVRERIEGIRAKVELEVRTRVASEKNRYAEEAIRRAIEEFKLKKGSSESYINYLKKALKEVVEETGGKKIVIEASEDDVNLILSIARELGVSSIIEVKPFKSLIGGFIAEVKEEGFRLDYTLDNILRTEDARLRRVALRALFGE
ncbi:MAG: hypothetical protein F7B17_02825 [Desulfurococcales archaeon]|nr:hypothetical protein [Desulfurococcales archaeon]